MFHQLINFFENVFTDNILIYYNILNINENKYRNFLINRKFFSSELKILLIQFLNNLIQV